MEQDIANKLDRIEKMLSYIKSRMVEEDEVMTEEDYESLLKYRKEKKEEKLVSHSSLKKDLGI